MSKIEFVWTGDPLDPDRDRLIGEARRAYWTEPRACPRCGGPRGRNRSLCGRCSLDLRAEVLGRLMARAGPEEPTGREEEGT